MLQLILFVSIAIASKIQSKKGSKGIDIERLSLLGDWIDEKIAENKIAGGSYIVYRKQAIIQESYHGYQNLNKSTPITKDTVYRIYSMTKPIVSVGLMMLYEKHKFKLNDPISKYIPSFSKANMRVYNYNQQINLTDISLDNIQTSPLQNDIQIWHLLTHTSGLTYGFDITGTVEPVDKLYNDNGISALGERNMTTQEFVDKLATMPLVAEPGTKWTYSLSTDVLGRLIEILSGQSLDEYLYKNIFEPLNMYHTTFKFEDIDENNLMTLYRNNGHDTLIDVSMLQNFRYFMDYPYLSGGAGLLSTLHDYLSFTKMLLNGGKLPGYGNKRLLSPKTIEFMTMSHFPYTAGFQPLPGFGIGTGFAVAVKQRLYDGYGSSVSPGTYWWGGAAMTWFSIDPSEDLCIVFMTQLWENIDIDFLSAMSAFLYSAITD